MNRIVMRIKKLTTTSSSPVTKGPRSISLSSSLFFPLCPAPFTSALNVAERRLLRRCRSLWEMQSLAGQKQETVLTSPAVHSCSPITLYLFLQLCQGLGKEERTPNPGPSSFLGRLWTVSTPIVFLLDGFPFPSWHHEPIFPNLSFLVACEN